MLDDGYRSVMSESGIWDVYKQMPNTISRRVSAAMCHLDTLLSCVCVRLVTGLNACACAFTEGLLGGCDGAPE